LLSGPTPNRLYPAMTGVRNSCPSCTVGTLDRYGYCPLCGFRQGGRRTVGAAILEEARECWDECSTMRRNGGRWAQLKPLIVARLERQTANPKRRRARAATMALEGPRCLSTAS